MNKKLLSVGLMMLFALQLGLDAQARETRRGSGSSDAVSTSSSASTTKTTVTMNKIGLGMTTLSALSSSTYPSLSALFDFSGGNTLQTLFSIGYQGGFSMGLGGIFRHDLKVSGDSGFHVGGGLLMSLSQSSAAAGGLAALFAAAAAAGAGGGSTLTFGLTAQGLGGFHVAVPGTGGALQASFDAGLNLMLSISSAVGFGFNIGGLSPALGLSLHYFL